MKVIREINEMQSLSMGWRSAGRLISLVPTAGALHHGHKVMIEQAKENSDVVVVSCFVNPSEFGPNEDYQRYPRDSDNDEAVCRDCGVDTLFFPDRECVFPDGYSTSVRESRIAREMCGVSRPHYFSGVCTWHTKLFNIVRPDRVILGQKDAQKAAVIEKMVEELSFPLSVERTPVVREPDGLACGARNRYLNSHQRADAAVLYKSLLEGKRLVENGIRNVDRIQAEVTHHISLVRRLRVIYVVAVDPLTMEPRRPEIFPGKTLLVASVWCDEVRLIDCLEL